MNGDQGVPKMPARKSRTARSGKGRRSSSRDTAPPPPAYAELQVASNFSFLRGASHAAELAVVAAAQGHHAFTVTDRNTLAGVVRGHLAARDAGIRFIVGCRLDLVDGPSVLTYPTDRAAYGRLSTLLTLGKRRAPKGECHLTRVDVAAHAEGMIFLVVPPEDAGDSATVLAPEGTFAKDLAEYRRHLGEDVYLAAAHRYGGDDGQRLHRLALLASRADTPMVATNDVHYHHPDRRRLQDVLTCIREHVTIDEAGLRLAANAERHLKPPAEMARVFRSHPEAIARTVDIAERCRFSLEELRYEYPSEVAAGGDPQQELERLIADHVVERYPDGVPSSVKHSIRHELDLIRDLAYAPYFLTVHDIVRFARSRGILCQGRGSAANSAVCYVLGITAVDPARMDLLFERFVSPERNEPPDIDVDFEHERREEVIQYIYEKYGRDRAGIAATVICYRSRAAIREVGKAMGLSVDTVGRLAKGIWGWSTDGVDEDRAREAGVDPSDSRVAMTLELARDLIGFPRHLSQHVGGFVITKGKLTELSPVMNAAMADRTTIEWDKDDIDALGILKVDVLALGMLTCVRKAFDLLGRHYGQTLTLASVPAEDPAVYDMVCKADTLGVFQIESRAQMSMLPRLRPRSFYDLVVEVAIVRPGPIQGDMVHPYLRRRNGEEAVDYPSEALRAVLSKTLGVPLFQEQAMRIAIVAGGFTPAEADRLRRAMATFRKVGIIHEFRDKLIEGMVANGYERDFATRCFQQIEGFGEYGFPESHAASFALLVYVSSWIKCHYPAAFAAALLNSQPMGFYAPAQIVRDAREHGVTVREVDVNHSAWDNRLEPEDRGGWALRLGFRQIKGFREDAAGKIVAARDGPRTVAEDRMSGPADGRTTHEAPKPFADPFDLWRRTRLDNGTLVRLADADAFRSAGFDRRKALWAIRRLGEEPLPLFAGLETPSPEPRVALPDMGLGEHVVNDYVSLSLSLKAHPVSFLRSGLAAERVQPTARLAKMRNRSKASVAGLVLVRQRPGTAKGVIFITLEDETGVANLVLMPDAFETYRRQVMGGRLLRADGRVEREGEVIHLKVERLTDLTGRLTALLDDYQDMPSALLDGAGLARADEVKRPTVDPRDKTVTHQAMPGGRNFH